MGRVSKLFFRFILVFLYTFVIISIVRFYNDSQMRQRETELMPSSYSNLKPNLPYSALHGNDDKSTSSSSNNNSETFYDDNYGSSKIDKELIESLPTEIRPNVIRVLCWIMTDPSQHSRLQPAKDTWTNLCDIRLFMSSAENETFPTIGLNVSAGRNHIAEKSKAAWTYVYNHYLKDADYFMKTDPDSYVAVDILKEYLSHYDPNEPAIYGHNMYLDMREYPKSHYVSGEAVVLSSGALIKLVTEGMRLPNCFLPGIAEDMKTCHCLTQVGGYIVDTRDIEGRETFLPPYQFVLLMNHTLPGGYKNIYRRPYGFCESLDCVTDHPIVFHYVERNEFYTMYYLFRNRRHLMELMSSSEILRLRSHLKFNGTRYKTKMQNETSKT